MRALIVRHKVPAHACVPRARAAVMIARHQGQKSEHTFGSIGELTGRSANAVKCRWQNKLKAETGLGMSGETR